MLTIEDLYDPSPKRKSKYKHVRHMGKDRPRPWKALFYSGSRTYPSGGGLAWSGPYRATEKEAAQDYCDYVNGMGAEAPVQLNRIPRPVSSTKAVAEVTDEERELRSRLRELEKERKAGRTEYVYLIAEKGSSYGVKVGYSVDPQGRPFGLQTGNPRELVLLGYIEGGKEKEAEIHQRHIGNNLVNEWFIPTAALFDEFGVDYRDWWHSLQGAIQAPESTLNDSV